MTVCYVLSFLLRFTDLMEVEEERWVWGVEGSQRPTAIKSAGIKKHV